jgi:hypothetical protein
MKEEIQEDYRYIASLMTRAGYQMNHSSVRNYVLKAMKKFAKILANYHGKSFSNDELMIIARSPKFQNYISNMLYIITHKDNRNDQ